MKKPRIERTSMISKTFNSRVASRPATATTSISVSQPVIHRAALGLEGVRSIDGQVRSLRCSRIRDIGKERGSYRRHRAALQCAKLPVLRCVLHIRCGIIQPIGAKDRWFRRAGNRNFGEGVMLVL